MTFRHYFVGKNSKTLQTKKGANAPFYHKLQTKKLQVI